jgi:hypothetical protein
MKARSGLPPRVARRYWQSHALSVLLKQIGVQIKLCAHPPRQIRALCTTVWIPSVIPSAGILENCEHFSPAPCPSD